MKKPLLVRKSHFSKEERGQKCLSDKIIEIEGSKDQSLKDQLLVDSLENEVNEMVEQKILSDKKDLIENISQI